MAKVSRSVVSTHWLFEKLQGSNLRVLDGTWNFPSLGQNLDEEYEACHIPGSVRFDVEVCRDNSSPYHHMLPTPQHFMDYVGERGIDNKNHVIIYDNHPSLGLFSAPRVWWMFRVFGHEKVSVLNGGLPKWMRENKPVTSQTTVTKKKNFKVSFNKALLKNFDEMTENIECQSYKVFDARSADRFYARAIGHYKDTPPGRMPGAVNVPYRSLLDPESKTLLNLEQLKEVLHSVGIQHNQKQIATCGTGISACLLCLAAHHCGLDKMAVYDGSWQEWYNRAQQKHKMLQPTEE